jgi:hypothetical protein
MTNRHPDAPILSALLPMGRLFDQVYVESIVPCSSELRMEAQRVQTEFSDHAALLTIQGQIRRAHLIIADLTAKNPNVLYLIGYAHALAKRVILIAQHGEDLPFPQSDYPTLIYAGNTFELLKELRGSLQDPSATPRGVSSSNGYATTAATAREKFCSLFGDLLTEHGCEHPGGIHMENDKTIVIKNQEMDFALVAALSRRARELGIRLKFL